MTTTSPAKAGFITLYALGYVGAYIALITPVATTLALKVGELDPAGKETSLGLISAIGALVAIVSNALSGALSDRTRSALFGFDHSRISDLAARTVRLAEGGLG